MACPCRQSSAVAGSVEAAGLTGRLPAGNLKSMRRIIFAACVSASLTVRAGAQTVPGRDLLDFPVGTLAEAPTLSTHMAGGHWNPAAAMLPPGSRGRLSVAALDASAEQAVSSQMLAAALAVPGDLTAALSVVRASVEDLRRTDTDPQTIGGDLQYSAMVVSAAVARRVAQYLTAGLAARYRSGVSAGIRESVIGMDGGLMAEGLPFRDARIGVSSHLWRPGSHGRDRATFSAAGDVRTAGRGPLREVRAGYGYAYAERETFEHYLFASARQGPLEGRGGAVRLVRHGEGEWRLRLGVGVHRGRYVVGVARDESGAGLAPTYQFTLSTRIP
jgi:hypothetical protein